MFMLLTNLLRRVRFVHALRSRPFALLFTVIVDCERQISKRHGTSRGCHARFVTSLILIPHYLSARQSSRHPAMGH